MDKTSGQVGNKSPIAGTENSTTAHSNPLVPIDAPLTNPLKSLKKIKGIKRINFPNLNEKDTKLKPFHLAEEDDQTKIAKLQREIGTETIPQKIIFFVMSVFIRRWMEILIDLLIFAFVLIPENHEFIHVIKEKLKHHKEKAKPYTQFSLAESFDFWCPILEGIVCVLHTVIFCLESFLGLEIKQGLLIAIVASHITCLLIIMHIEIVDRKKRKHSNLVITIIELQTIFLSTLITIFYIKTEDKFRTFILICTVIIQFLCRTLTRIVEESHNAVRKLFNNLKIRIVIATSILITGILIEVSYLYIQEHTS
ncbi:hypothetical protein NEOKW01_1675 [Nematocida sp. AWRm80]|nr:hypothetical protein NEOKW01_1675 [Nematocida sp. AWRm80]